MVDLSCDSSSVRTALLMTEMSLRQSWLFRSRVAISTVVKLTVFRTIWGRTNVAGRSDNFNLSIGSCPLPVKKQSVSQYFPQTSSKSHLIMYTRSTYIYSNSEQKGVTIESKSFKEIAFPIEITVT